MLTNGRMNREILLLMGCSHHLRVIPVAIALTVPILCPKYFWQVDIPFMEARLMIGLRTGGIHQQTVHYHGDMFRRSRTIIKFTPTNLLK